MRTTTRFATAMLVLAAAMAGPAMALGGSGLSPELQARLSAHQSVAPLTPQQRNQIAGRLMKSAGKSFGGTPSDGGTAQLSLDHLSVNGRYLTVLYPLAISHVETGEGSLMLNADSEIQVNIEGGVAGKNYLVDCRISDDQAVSWTVDGAGGVAASGQTSSSGNHLSFLVQTASAQKAVLRFRSLNANAYIAYGCDVTALG